jgi:hypothetical protein
MDIEKESVIFVCPIAILPMSPMEILYARQIFYSCHKFHRLLFVFHENIVHTKMPSLSLYEGLVNRKSFPLYFCHFPEQAEKHSDVTDTLVTERTGQ